MTGFAHRATKDIFWVSVGGKNIYPEYYLTSSSLQNGYVIPSGATVIGNNWWVSTFARCWVLGNISTGGLAWTQMSIQILSGLILTAG